MGLGLSGHRRAGLKGLPTLPEVAIRILKLVDDPRTTVKDVVRAIESDASLVAQLLKLVNSPLYGFRSQITSVERAILLVGFYSVRNLALGISVLNAFRGRMSRELKGLWRHSIEVGCVAKVLCEAFPLPLTAVELSSSDVFTWGLLHDVGRIALCYLHGDGYVGSVLSGEELDLTEGMEKERSLYGTDHAELGATLLEEWALPAHASRVVRAHHLEPAPGVDVLSALHLYLYLGEGLSHCARGVRSPEELEDRLKLVPCREISIGKLGLFSDPGLLFSSLSRGFSEAEGLLSVWG